MFSSKNFPLKIFMRSASNLKSKVLAKKLTMDQIYKKHGIIPDVLCRKTESAANICFPNGKKVKLGNILTPTEVKDRPDVTWKANENFWYLLSMIDPDAPCRTNPKFREWIHWMIGNIPGRNTKKGEILYDFIPSAPPKDTGLHRYVFLVYLQPMKLDFTCMEKFSNKSPEGRPNFNSFKFAEFNSLGHPVASNFYLAKYDDHVPKVYESLGVL